MAKKDQGVKEGGSVEEDRRREIIEKIVSFAKNGLGFQNDPLSAEEWLKVETMLAQATQSAHFCRVTEIHRKHYFRSKEG